MKLSDLSIKRPVLAVVMSLLLLVLGVMSFMRLTLRELPAIDPPIVSVDVTYPGASAAVVETRVTQVLEDSLSGIEGVETLQSRSVNGRSSVTLSSSPSAATSRPPPTTCAMPSAGSWTACRSRPIRLRSPR